MEILVYQVGIFCTIYIAGLFGKNARNVITLIIALLTLLIVFTTWLGILQFITIFIAYFFSINQEEKAKQRKLIRREHRNFNESNINNNNSYYFFFLIVIAMICAFSVTMNKNHLNHETLSKENEKIIDKPTFNVVDSTIYSTGKIQEYDNDSAAVTTDDDYVNDNIRDSDEDDDYSFYEDEQISYGDFEFFRNINDNEIENGSILIRKINNNDFYFKLKVDNQYSTGEISGVATFLNSTTAIFSSDGCKSINFQFLNNKQIKIMEDNCLNYHGNRIGFDGIFKK